MLARLRALSEPEAAAAAAKVVSPDSWLLCPAVLGCWLAGRPSAAVEVPGLGTNTHARSGGGLAILLRLFTFGQSQVVDSPKTRPGANGVCSRVPRAAGVRLITALSPFAHPCASLKLRSLPFLRANISFA